MRPNENKISDAADSEADLARAAFLIQKPIFTRAAIRSIAWLGHNYNVSLEIRRTIAGRCSTYVGGEYEPVAEEMVNEIDKSISRRKPGFSRQSLNAFRQATSILRAPCSL